MRSLEARSISVDNPFSFGNFSIRKRLVDNLSEVIANDLGQAGRVDGHDIGAVDREDIVNCLDKIGLASEDGGSFRKGTGCCHDRIFIMSGQGTPMVGATTLRTVAVGEAVVNSQGRIHGAHGLAGLGRIDSQGRPVCEFFRCMS